MGALCLACTVYSLGILNTSWDALPAGIRGVLLDAAKNNNLSDQTMANVVSSLSLSLCVWGGTLAGLTSLSLSILLFRG